MLNCVNQRAGQGGAGLVKCGVGWDCDREVVEVELALAGMVGCRVSSRDLRGVSGSFGFAVASKGSSGCLTGTRPVSNVSLAALTSGTVVLVLIILILRYTK